MSALKKWTAGPRGPIVLGPTVRFEKVDSWAPDSWAPGPNCPRPNCPGPKMPYSIRSMKINLQGNGHDLPIIRIFFNLVTFLQSVSIKTRFYNLFINQDIAA